MANPLHTALLDFLNAVEAGEVLTRCGWRDGDKLMEGVTELTLDVGPEGLTAEAFRLGIIHESFSWQTGVTAMRRALMAHGPRKAGAA